MMDILSSYTCKGQLSFTRKLKVSMYLTSTHSKTPVLALFNIIKLPVPLLSSFGPLLFKLIGPWPFDPNHKTIGMSSRVQNFRSGSIQLLPLINSENLTVTSTTNKGSARAKDIGAAELERLPLARDFSAGSFTESS